MVSDRDMQRYSMSRPSPLPVDEQQRMQHSSQMLPSRNIMHSSVAVSGAFPTGNDHGVHMPSGANGLGMMCRMKRGMAMPRPAFQGIGSPSMINMVPPANGVGMASPVNSHNGSVSGQGNPIIRPREALQMLRVSLYLTYYMYLHSSCIHVFSSALLMERMLFKKQRNKYD